jgi:16S rRNA (adenine1518-N6/adenine1519-N6)-dimethyltransferase
MTHPSTLLKALEQRAKKRFGQHFLVSSSVVRQIIAASDVGEGSRVLEIGPGLGVLTEALLGAGAAVTAIELDRDMAGFIRDRLPEVELIEADAARVDFGAHLPGSGWRCVANLPYNAGTRMITRMLSAPDTFDRLVVMVQREVAERLVAPAGDRKRGSLSVFAEARAASRICVRVPPGAFHPPPNVHSAVIDMRLHPTPQVGGVSIGVFDSTVRSLFVQPRKTIRNNLSAALDRSLADTVLDAAKLDPRRRPATLTLGEIVCLSGAVEEAQAS